MSSTTLAHATRSIPVAAMTATMSGDPVLAQDERHLVPSGEIRLPHGLPGFPETTRFRLERAGGDAVPLLRLTALEDDGPSFLVAWLAMANPLVGPVARAHACDALGADGDELQALVIVTIERGSEGVRAFANLRAPVFLDLRRRIGAQLVLRDPHLAMRHPLSLA